MRFAPALRLFRKRSVLADSQDPADLGTAFGMEASLAGEEAYQLSRPPPSYELESEALARLAQESPLAWLSRRSGN